jgi:hypothetical protein
MNLDRLSTWRRKRLRFYALSQGCSFWSMAQHTCWASPRHPFPGQHS